MPSSLVCFLYYLFIYLFIYLFAAFYLQKVAVERLLHRAVADVSDDVRRAAVLALGFVLCAHGEEVGFLAFFLSLL